MWRLVWYYSAGIYLFKVSNRNTRKMCSKLTKRILEMTDFTNCSVISIFDFEQANVVYVSQMLKMLCLHYMIRAYFRSFLWSVFFVLRLNTATHPVDLHTQSECRPDKNLNMGTFHTLSSSRNFLVILIHLGPLEDF